MKKLAMIVMALLLAAALTSCTRAPKAIAPTEDSFVIRIQFDTDVDVYEVGYKRGDGESGGFSYADGTKLNDVVYAAFNDEIWGDAPRMKDFFISIRPIIEGQDVPYVDINAQYGNTYYVTVSGTAETGYTAVQTEGKK